MELIRRRYIFEGRVQGVGFRLTAVSCSRGLDLSGYVRNQNDGSVELDVQGTSADIQTMVDKLVGQQHGIANQHVHSLPVKEGSGSVVIRY